MTAGLYHPALASAAKAPASRTDERPAESRAKQVTEIGQCTT